MPLKDKAARAAYNKEYNRTHRYAKTSDQQAAEDRRRAGRSFLLDMAKARPCADCGNRYPACVMDFDHVTGSKRKAVGHLRLASTAVVFAEIAKCELVCSNCHRIRTRDRLCQ